MPWWSQGSSKIGSWSVCCLLVFRRVSRVTPISRWVTLDGTRWAVRWLPRRDSVVGFIQRGEAGRVLTIRITLSFLRRELPLLRHRSMELDTLSLSTSTPSYCSSLVIACGIQSECQLVCGGSPQRQPLAGEGA
jgi:hypothetical protein